MNYTRCGDSAIWTGHYLAAEAFRYAVTRSPDALDNARRAFSGIWYLVGVTGNNVLARCIVPDDSPYALGIQSEEAPNGIYRSTPGSFWVGNTSRDQYSGVLFGLSVAYDLIDDQALRASIAELVTRMVQFLKDHDWTVVLPDGTITTTFIIRPDQQLAFLQLARHVNSNRFSTSYDISRVLLAPGVIAPIAYDVLSDDSYFKFNLDTINLYTLIRLESSSFGKIYRKAYDILRNHTDNHGNAFFNMIDRALNGPNPARDAETRALLDQWLLRSRRDFFVDNRGRYSNCGEDLACNPIQVPDRVVTDFLWQRSPFQMSGGGSGRIESAGIDYILPYWMARYYGVLGPDNLRVVSAASGASALAPGAIGSVFGVSLATSPASSGVQPLPQALGGVSVTVKDSTGVSHPAEIYFVSAGQVNFVVPQDTAPGIASITIQGSGSTITMSAEVGTVAPALFTADSSGKGAASATALRMSAGGMAPVAVFTCAESTCSPVPIKLGLDAPVYLSFYGSGIRNRSSFGSVSCTIGGLPVPVLYAGGQPEYAGLDQINVALPLELRGLGESDVIVTVDGQASNPVRINIE